MIFEDQDLIVVIPCHKLLSVIIFLFWESTLHMLRVVVHEVNFHTFWEVKRAFTDLSPWIEPYGKALHRINRFHYELMADIEWDVEPSDHCPWPKLNSVSGDFVDLVTYVVTALLHEVELKSLFHLFADYLFWLKVPDFKSLKYGDHKVLVIQRIPIMIWEVLEL